MHKLIIVLLSTLIATTLNAQHFLMPEEEQLYAPLRNIKGDVKQIENWSFHEIGGLKMKFHGLSTFQDQRVVRSTSYEYYGTNTTQYSYLSDGRIAKQITTRIDTIKDTTFVSATRHFEYQKQKVKISYDFFTSVKTRYFELDFDQYNRLVIYKSYLGKELKKDKAYTYDFNTKERKLLNSLLVEYEHGQPKKTVSELYSYAPASVNGEDCTRILIEKGTHSDDYERLQRWEQYRHPDGQELKGKAYYYNSPSRYEFRYTYDEKGNWIIRERYKLPSGHLESYFQRKITYADGSTNAVPEFDVVTIKNKKIEVDPNSYFTFKRYVSRKSYHIYNVRNKAVNNHAVNMGAMNTDHFFVYYPPTQSVIELTNYQKAANNQRSDAQILSSNLSQYVFNNEQGNYWFMKEGKAIPNNHFTKVELTHDYFVVSFKEEGKSYAIKWPKDKKQNFVRPFQALPPTHNNTYWYSYQLEDGQGKDFVFFEHGKIVRANDTSLYRGILKDGEDLILMTVNNRYRLKNWQEVGVDTLLRTYAVSELEYEQAMANYLDQLAKREEAKAAKQAQTAEVAKQPQATTAARPTGANQNNFGCYSSIACLNGKAVQQYKAALATGQSTEQAYEQMAQVFETVYQNKKELSFDMMMKIDGQYTMGLTKALPAEVRAYIRQRSSQAVNQHVKKYGAPKIKTVPYQPKN
ncbi:MAG: hypothetical protein AAGG75_09635 [Bacteroidota bacterium]